MRRNNKNVSSDTILTAAPVSIAKDARKEASFVGNAKRGAGLHAPTAEDSNGTSVDAKDDAEGETTTGGVARLTRLPPTVVTERASL